MKPETRLDIAGRLVAEAQAIVKRQEKLIADLEDNGQPTERSDELLELLVTALMNFKRTLALLRAAQP